MSATLLRPPETGGPTAVPSVPPGSTLAVTLDRRPELLLAVAVMCGLLLAMVMRRLG